MAESALLGSNLPINYKGLNLKQENNKNFGNKRKRPRWAEGNEENEKELIFDTTPFPTSQPTHTGYLTSATLLPKFKIASSPTV